jgi:hypothetical protein
MVVPNDPSPKPYQTLPADTSLLFLTMDIVIVVVHERLIRRLPLASHLQPGPSGPVHLRHRPSSRPSALTSVPSLNFTDRRERIIAMDGSRLRVIRSPHSCSQFRTHCYSLCYCPSFLLSQSRHADLRHPPQWRNPDRIQHVGAPRSRVPIPLRIPSRLVPAHFPLHPTPSCPHASLVPSGAGEPYSPHAGNPASGTSPPV